MGYPRLPLTKQAQLVPSILSCLNGKPSSQQDTLLSMIVPVLGEISCPIEDQKPNYLGLNDAPAIKSLLLTFLMDYLLLPYGSHPQSQQTQEKPPPPPGLNVTAWKSVAGESPGTPAPVLEQRKCAVVKFLGQGYMKEMEIALHLAVAVADTRHSVVAVADSALRRLSGCIDWEDPGLVGKLYNLFLGTLVVKDKSGKTNSPQNKPENRRSPANTRIRLKLMPYLLKSRQAAIQFPQSIQVTFDLLFGTSGNSNAKLRTMAIQFVHHMVQHCPEERLQAIGPVLLSALTRVVNTPLDADSEPLSNAAKEVIAKQRASCYVAIGKLGSKVPSLINNDMSVIATFFAALSSEDKETQMSVQEALSLMAHSCKQMPENNLDMLEAMLGNYINNDESQVRLVSVQYAGEVFPSNHVTSRYILLIGAGDVKEEVANGAKAHLYGALKKYEEKKSSGRLLPEFEPMLKLILEKSALKILSKHRLQIGGIALPFRPEIYAEMLNFLRMSLIYAAGSLPDFEMLSSPLESAPKVTNFLGKTDSALVTQFLEFAERLMQAKQGPAPAQALLQIVGCSPVLGSDYFAKKLNWIKGLLANTREDIRENAAHLYGIVASSLSDQPFDSAIQDLMRSFKEKQVEFQHGVIVAIGFAFGRKLRVKQDLPGFKQAVDLVVSQLDNQQVLAMSAGCLALGEIGRNGALPFPEKSGEEENTKQSIVDKLISMVKSGKISMKVRERAATAAGLLCVGEKFPIDVVKRFLELMPDIKEIELHLTMGEAIVYAVLGQLSPIARNLWTEETFVCHDDASVANERLEWVIHELTSKHMLSTHPNVKQASCIFLLAILQNGQQFEAVKSRLANIQGAFMGLLGDNNDLVQDAASKGLGIVYDACSEEQRDSMVNRLLQTLLEGNRKVQQVSKDSKIFEDGQMGKAPSGANLTTYKELCSLASDLNQPDLVYKFMNLANHNAMWNSKRGAAFGFGTIAAKAGEQLEPHLAKIIPKLYRYQFDPTPKIQQSMQSIWNALVTDTSKTVDQYLPQILDDLRANLTNNQWRVRESCCVALQDLLRGRTLESAVQVLPSLWSDLFRVMDDIKESVRLAAGKTVAALSRNCIRMCDVSQSGSKSGQKAIEVILPVLLEKGLLSNVGEVKAAALNVIVKITKSAGILLKPHLAILIPSLLEATSELESSQVGYLSTRLANDADVQEKLDAARIAAAKSSSLMECVNFVIQFVDQEVLSELVPRLVDLIKHSVGLGTKGTTAHVVTALTHQCPLELQPFTSKLLAAFLAGLSDRNPAVRKTYASAIGQLLKTAKDKSVEKLFAKLRTWYMEKDDEASKWAVAYTFQAITRHNPDKMKEHAAEALPIAFLAMHEEKSEAFETWEEVWSEGTPGTEGGIRLFLTEIVSLLSLAIESPQWKVKAQSARAIGTVAQKLGEKIPPKEQKVLFALLLNGLAGRTWNGKEDLLVALSDVCKHGSASIKHCLADNSEQDMNITEDILVQCLLKECQKERMSYKIAALDAIGVILNELEIDRFEDLFERFFQIIEVREEEEEDEEQKPSYELQESVIKCLGKAWPANPETQKKYGLKFLTALCVLVQATTRSVQLTVARCLDEVMSRWLLGQSEEEFIEIAKLLSAVLTVPKHGQLRQTSLKVLDKVIGLLEKQGDAKTTETFKEEIAKSLDYVIKDLGSDPATKDNARQLKKRLWPEIIWLILFSIKYTWFLKHEIKRIKVQEKCIHQTRIVCLWIDLEFMVVQWLYFYGKWMQVQLLSAFERLKYKQQNENSRSTHFLYA